MLYPTHLEIPLKGSDNVLEIQKNMMPTPKDLRDIFYAEEAPLRYFVIFALEFARQNESDNAISILLDGLRAEYEPNPRPRLPLHNLLASLYTRKANQPGLSHQERVKLWEMAAFQLGAAEKINPKDETTWICKGLIMLAKGMYDDAHRHFRQVMNDNRRCIPALLVQARIQYIREQYPAAIGTYRKVLEIWPGCTPNPRMGMGICFYKLGMREVAEEAFQRCIELNPSDPTAHTLLAIIEFNHCKRTDLSEEEMAESYQRGFGHLRNAYMADKKHPVVGLYMGKHFAITKDVEKAMAFATKASNMHGLKDVQAEGYYLMGKLNHQIERYNDACMCYHKATSIDPDHLLAQFGYGQTLLFKADIATAIGAFEKVHSKEPKCIEAIAVLGSIYSRSPASRSKALEYFNRATNIIHERNSLASQDPLMFTEMAQILEQTDISKASKAYAHALEICTNRVQQGQTVEYMPELLNNVAAMSHLDNKLGAAEDSYAMALDLCETKFQDNSADATTEAILTTIRYNLARLYEDKNEITKAEDIYKNITERYHGYANAHLRLGVIEQSRGNFEEAAKLYKDVYGMIDNKNVDAWTLMGMLQQKQNQIRNSRKTLERIVKEINRHDVYALVALGNNALGVAREEKENIAVKNDMYKKAFEFFDKVLKIDERNVFAANGIAIALASNNSLAEAKDLFTQLREAASTIPEIWLNLALISSEMGHYRNAVLLYSNVSKKFYNDQDENVILCMAKAQYCVAKSEKNPEEMKIALQLAQKAYRLFPSDKSNLYDIALIQQSYAQLISDRATNQRTVEDIHVAMAGLSAAKNILKALIAPSKQHVYYDRVLAAQREKHGDSLLTILQRKLKDQESFEAEKKRLAEEARLKREADQQRAEEEERARIQKQQEEEREIAERRRQLDLGAKEMQKELDESRERSERKRMVDSDDDAASDVGGENGEPAPKKVKKDKKPREPKEPKEPKERKGKLRKKSDLDGGRGGRGKSNSDGEDEDEPVARTTATTTSSSKKYKSKEIIDSDDDESD